MNSHILLPKLNNVIQHQLIPSICTSTHRIELKSVKLLLEKSKLFGLASNSAKVVIKKTNKKDKNTKPTRIRRQEPTAYSCKGVFTDQIIFRKISRSLTNQSAKPTDLKNFCLPFDEELRSLVFLFDILYRRIPIITVPVIFGFSRPKGPLSSGSRYFRMVRKSL